MNILLIGYGKMGKAIEQIALSRGHKIAAIIDTPEDKRKISSSIAIDVAIEFSQSEAALENLTFCFDKGIPVVCGTTGWLEARAEVVADCKQKNGTFFYASNFSLGVNLFFKLNEYLAKLMAGQPSYQLSIEETHHTQKKDAPSGTAITLAEDILAANHSFKHWELGEKPSDGAIVINSFRVDPVAGTHVVKYHSEIDDIEIRHTAHSRQGFALGAVLVAEWVQTKRGVLSMDDFLTL
jgi:4-hydroxy-tetrahydrodipicolinate reductase